MYTNVPKELWMMLPAEERNVLVEHFDISKSGYTEVNDNRVVQDGFTSEDLKKLTSENMAEFVGDSADLPFPRLWELTVAKAHSIVNPPVGVMKSKDSVIETMVVDDGGDIEVKDVSDGAIIETPKETTHAPAKKKGRPAKK
jgi:hypothetical protein